MSNGDIINDDNEGYLILDKATSNISKEVLNEMTNRNREISFIPGGLTRFFQPLDVAINKPFKSAMKEKYISYCINNGIENLKVMRSKMIDMVCEIWYNSDIITSEMIYNSFRYTGIANALNHSEDNLFNSWQRMKDEKPLIDNDLENDFDFNDNLDDNNEILDDDEN